MAAPLRIFSLLTQSSFARTGRQLQSTTRRRWGSVWQGRINANEIERRAVLVQTRSGSGSSSANAIRTSNATAIPTSKAAPTRQHVTVTPSSSVEPAVVTAAAVPEAPFEPYRPPTTGLLSALPPACVPYAELIRLDKPIGTYYLFLPCFFSMLLAAPLISPMPTPMTVVYTSGLFFVGALIMRGAGCTVNDLWDRNLDPHVARTRLRPIARGAISVRQAVPFLGVQLISGLALLLQFPHECLFYAIPSLLFVAAYPLAKRVTNYPQAFLGLTFSWGAIVGFPALGVDLLSNTPALISAACLYGSCVAWTIVYDMIYAYQDIRDDAKAGIKSIALAQDTNAKLFLSVVGAVQVALLTGAGAAIGAGPVYFVGTCGGAAATLSYMIRTVKLHDVKDCWKWFNKGAWLTGGAISFGLIGEYLLHYFDLYADKQPGPLRHNALATASETCAIEERT